MIAGFHPENKSDEELMAMLSELQRRILFVCHTGMSNSALHQLQAMEQIVSTLLSERAEEKVHNARIKAQKQSVVSDPSVSTEHQTETKNDRATPRARPNAPKRMMVVRSDKPSNQIQIDPPKET